MSLNAWACFQMRSAGESEMELHRSSSWAPTLPATHSYSLHALEELHHPPGYPTPPSYPFAPFMAMPNDLPPRVAPLAPDEGADASLLPDPSPWTKEDGGTVWGAYECRRPYWGRIFQTDRSRQVRPLSTGSPGKVIKPLFVGGQQHCNSPCPTQLKFLHNMHETDTDYFSDTSLQDPSQIFCIPSPMRPLSSSGHDFFLINYIKGVYTDHKIFWSSCLVSLSEPHE